MPRVILELDSCFPGTPEARLHDMIYQDNAGTSVPAKVCRFDGTISDLPVSVLALCQ